jgi:hypothetical protein
VLDKVVRDGHLVIPRLNARNRRPPEQLAPGYVEHPRGALLYRLDARARVSFATRRTASPAGGIGHQATRGCRCRRVMSWS